MSIPLLTTKLYFPPARVNLVPRPRLMDRMDAGLGKPLTLISAPAGYGKTSLLSAWRAEAGHDFPAAWLSLDAQDNDLTRFLEYVAAALDRLTPNLTGSFVSLLRLPQIPPMEVLLTGLINCMSAYPQDFALILDDYHNITESAIQDALAFLIDHLPIQTHIVLLTRSDPPLPLARLLARNQLTEIRQEHLLFTFDEASSFLKRTMGLNLSEEQIGVLETRTEGWIAGLQMAGLTLQNRKDVAEFIAAFQGDDRYVMDYLMEEIFRSQPSEIQDFLLQTAILDRLCSAACDAITGITSTQQDSEEKTSSRNSQSILEHLERNNLFLLPLDNKREWYRYHQLFADLLRYRLQQERPQLIPELHKRACLWFKQAGDGDEAMKHALAVPDDALAADVAEEYMLAMVGSSRLAAYSQWVQHIPSEIVKTRAYLCVGSGWTSLLFNGQPDLAEDYAVAGEAALPEFQPLYSAPARRWITSEEVRGQLTAIKAHAARMRGDYPRAIELSRRALQELPPDVYVVRCILALNLGLLYMGMGNLDEARTACLEAVETALKSGENNNIALTSLSVLAGISTWRGKLLEAQEFCHSAFNVSGEDSGQAPDLGVSYAHGWLTEVHLLRNEMDEAAAHLESAIRYLEQIGAPDNLAYGYLYRTRLSIEQGDIGQAKILMQKIRDMVSVQPGSDIRVAEQAIMQGMLLLAQGRLDEAVRWLADQGVIAGNLPEVTQLNPVIFQRLRNWLPAYLLLARALLAQGETDQVMGLLNNVSTLAEAMQNYTIMLEAQVFRAVGSSAQRRGQAEAMEHLERSLRMAAPEGYVLPFLHAGQPLVTLLRQAIVQGIEPGYAQKLLKDLAELERRLALQTGTPGMSRGFSSAVTALAEPLTVREKQVLRLLAAGLSSTEVAEDLVISVSTARSYIKSLYGKLDAHSRDEAIEKGRQFGLL